MSEIGALSVRFTGDTTGLDAAFLKASADTSAFATKANTAAKSAEAAGVRMGVGLAGGAKGATEQVGKAGAELGRLQTALGNTGYAVEKLSKGIEHGLGLGSIARFGAIAAAAIILTEAIRGATAMFRSLDEAAATTGETVQNLAALSAVGKLVGLQFATMESAIKSFDAAVHALKFDEVTPATEALHQLGLNATNADGSFRTFAGSLPEIADRFANMANGARKTELAVSLFGQAGEKLLPLLNRGAGGVEELRKKAAELGLTLDEEGVAKAKSFTEAIDKMSVSWTKLSGIMAMFISGPLEAIANAFDKINDQQRKASKGLELQDNADQIEIQRQKIERWSEALAVNNRLLEDEKKLAADPKFGDRSAAIEALTDQIADLTKKIKAAEAEMNHLTLEGEAMKNPFAGDKTTVTPFKDPLQDFKEIDFVKKDLDAVIDRLNGMPVLFANAFTFDTSGFEGAMAKVNNAVELGAITATDANKIKLSLERQYQNAILDTASKAAAAITTLFPKSKAASIAAAVINTAVGVTKALSEVPWPMNWVQAALVAATGAAQIAQIRSTTESGGGGGAAPIPSGAASAGSATGAGAPVSNTLYVEGINPNSLFTGSAMRDFAERLIAYQRDGGQVVLAP